MVGANLFYVKQVLPAGLPSEDLFNKEAGLAVPGQAALINDSNLSGLEEAQSDVNAIGYVLVERSSFLNPSTLSSNITPTRNGLLNYRVEEGDTVSAIAAKFGISVNTVIWANDLAASGQIKPGKEIIILPISGVLHKVTTGETLSSIAALYGVETDRIASFNREALKAGDTVVVPNAKPVSSKKSVVKKKKEEGGSRAQASLSAGGYFISPLTNGLNWGRLHDGNAVDIAAQCGTSIVAAASGLVTEVASPTRWNSGYGGFVRISHPNGTGTFYGHTSANLVDVGEEISQGDTIARVGRTGSVSGITGCHVHFGVSGARNPFVR